MKTGIITKPTAWLYGKDRLSHIDEIFMGWAAGILKESNEWYEIVTHYGYRGYLKKEMLAICSTEELWKRDHTGETVFISRAFVDVMEEANVHSKIICTLVRGSFVSLLSEIEKGYRRIRMADGREGYIPLVACKSRRDNDGYLYEGEPETYFLHQRGVRRSGEQSFRRNAVLYAKSYLGTQYRWGGKSPKGIDCSGLTFMCYFMNGILIYRDAELKANYPVQEISIEKMQPGDLLYFPKHIAIYLGHGMYAHATGNEKSFGCVINSLLKEDFNYRKDLAESILAVGSIW